MGIGRDLIRIHRLQQSGHVPIDYGGPNCERGEASSVGSVGGSIGFWHKQQQLESADEAPGISFRTNREKNRDFL